VLVCFKCLFRRHRGTAPCGANQRAHTEPPSRNTQKSNDVPLVRALMFFFIEEEMGAKFLHGVP